MFASVDVVVLNGLTLDILKDLLDCRNKAIKALKSQTSFHSHHTVAASSGLRENVKLIKIMGTYIR